MKDYEGAEFEAEEHRKEREEGAYERVVETLVDDLMRGETIGRRYGYPVDLACVLDGVQLFSESQFAILIYGDEEAASDVANDAKKRARKWCEEFLKDTKIGRSIVEACVEDEIAEGRE